MAKSIFEYKDAEGFLPEGHFDEWGRKNNLRREPASIGSPRYDGIYATEEREYEVQSGYDWETYRTRGYLRFYPDGMVLYEYANMKWPPSPEEMAVVFKRENDIVKSRGIFKLRGGQIAFEVIEVGPKRGLLLPAPKTKLNFLGLSLPDALYIVTETGGKLKYSFTPIKAYQEEIRLALAQLKEKGHMHQKASQWDLALPFYEEYLRIDPTNDDMHFLMGRCLHLLGMHDQALTVFEQACRLRPTSGTYHNCRGEELLALGRCQDAIEAFKYSLATPYLPPYASMQAWGGMSNALQALGQTREAQEAQQKSEQSEKEYQLQVPVSSQTLSSSTFTQTPPVIQPQPTQKIGTTLVTYQQPGSKVDGLAWSPDGRHIASFGLGKTQVWEPLSGNLLYDYNVKGFATIITAIAWSPDSTRIATGGSDKVVQIWVTSDGHITTAYKGHHKFIRALSWSPNGQHVASCEDTELHIWNALSGQPILTFTAHPKTLVGMRALAWSPDATRIASGGGNDHVTIWNPDDGSAISTYTQQRSTINGLAWSPDGKRIASASSDSTIHIWAVETGADQIVCKGHTNVINTVAFSPDGRRIASACNDGTVRIWDSETGQQIFTYGGHKKNVTTLAWSPDGRYIASGGVDKTVQVWACR